MVRFMSPSPVSAGLIPSYFSDSSHFLPKVLHFTSILLSNNRTYRLDSTSSARRNHAAWEISYEPTLPTLQDSAQNIKEHSSINDISCLRAPYHVAKFTDRYYRPFLVFANSCWKMRRSVTNLGKSKPGVEFVVM